MTDEIRPQLGSVAHENKNITNQSGSKVVLQMINQQQFSMKNLQCIDWNQFEAYQKLCEPNKVDLSVFSNDVDKACSFYFQLLRKLKMKLYSARIELQSEKEAIQQSKNVVADRNKQYFDIRKEYRDQQIWQRQSQNQVSNQKEGRSKSRRQQSRQQQNVNMVMSINAKSGDSQLVDVVEFECKIRGCSRIFEKKSTLLHHQMLKHNSPVCDLHKNKVFQIQIKDSGELGVGKRVIKH